MTQDLTNADIFLWSLYRLGGARSFVDVEDVFVLAFETAPARFSWRTRDDLPDLKKCAKALRDAEARTPALLAKSVDRYKRQLTARGYEWIGANAERLEASLGAGSEAVQATGRQKTSDDRRLRRESERLMSTTAFQKFVAGKAESISPKEAEAFFRLNDYITGTDREAKIQRVLNMFGEDSQLSSAILAVAERVPRIV